MASVADPDLHHYAHSRYIPMGGCMRVSACIKGNACTGKKRREKNYARPLPDDAPAWQRHLQVRLPKCKCLSYTFRPSPVVRVAPKGVSRDFFFGLPRPCLYPQMIAPRNHVVWTFFFFHVTTYVEEPPTPINPTKAECNLHTYLT